jgi:hypothetical protein
MAAVQISAELVLTAAVQLSFLCLNAEGGWLGLALFLVLAAVHAIDDIALCFMILVSTTLLAALKAHLLEESPFMTKKRGQIEVVAFTKAFDLPDDVELVVESASRPWLDPLVWTSGVYGVAAVHAMYVGQWGLATILVITTAASTLFHLYNETKVGAINKSYAAEDLTP